MAESKGGDDFQGAYAKMGIDVNEGAGAGAGAHGNPWGNWGVECFQARIIQCHVENLPPGSRPGNSKIWDKCLQSSSGKTYMFVRTLRTAIHGKVRHAYLLEETAPGSGRYNFLQSEQRAIKEMGLASINSGQLAEDPKTEILVQDRLGIPGCNFVCGLHECTFDARNVYSVLPYCDGGELFSTVEESGALPEQQVKIYFRQIMQGTQTREIERGKAWKRCSVGNDAVWEESSAISAVSPHSHCILAHPYCILAHPYCIHIHIHCILAQLPTSLQPLLTSCFACFPPQVCSTSTRRGSATATCPWRMCCWRTTGLSR
jgi:hypothetical protein